MDPESPDTRQPPVRDPHAERSGGLLDELRRRRVVRTGLAYAGAAFVVLQAADLVLGALDAPREIFRVLVLVTLVGFPVTLVLAWIFELSSEGIRVTGRAEGRGRLVAAFDLRRVGLALAAVLLCTVGVFATLRVTQARSAVAAPSERATVVAVLPFSISGATPGVLEEGIIDLLTRNLDQVGTLRTVDPRRILRSWGKEAPDGPLSLPDAHDLAEATGAELIVTGSVVSVAEEIRLTAEVHTIAGERLGSVRVDGPASGFLRLVDDLSISLLREVWRSTRPVPGLSMEGVSSGSLEAIRAYLNGERLYRVADWGPALESFRRAIAADPDFALAHFRVLSTAFWLGDDAGIQSALATVLPLMDRLPPREQALVRVLELEIAGDRSAAIDSLGAYVGRYPDDPEGWFRMADNMYHLQSDRAGPLDRPTGRDLWMFDEVLQRDPEFTMALVHPLEVAFELADTALIARYLSLLPPEAHATSIYRLAERAIRSGGEQEALVEALLAAVEGRAGAQNFDWQASRAVLQPLVRLAAVQPAAVRTAVVEQLGSRLGSHASSSTGIVTRLHLLATTGDIEEYERVLRNPSVRVNLGAGPSRWLTLVPALAGFVEAAPIADTTRASATNAAAVALLRGVDDGDPAAVRRAAAGAAAIPDDSIARIVAAAGAGFATLLEGDAPTGLRQVEDALRGATFMPNSVVEALWFRWAELAVSSDATRARVEPLLSRPWPGLAIYEAPRLLALSRLRQTEGDRAGASAAYAAYLRAAPSEGTVRLARRRIEQVRDVARRLTG